MRLKSKHIWFLAFTAAFAVLAGFVFWGTWSLDYAPVMPDAPLTFSPDWLSDWWRSWLREGSFVPTDILFHLGSPYLWQEMSYALSMYASGLAVAYFLRGRGLTHLASYGAGLLLAFCGYWCTLFSAGHNGWFFWMTYGLWPLGLFDRAIRKGKTINWVLLGATIGWAAYRQPDLWFLFAVFTGMYFACRCICARIFPWRGLLIAGLSMFVFGGAAFHWAIVRGISGRDEQIARESGTALTGGEKGKKSGDERWIFVTNWSLPTAESLEFFIPRLNGDTSCPMTLSIGAQNGTGVKPYTGALGRPIDAKQGNYRQHSLYVGWLTCLLALLGMVTAIVRRERRGDIAFFAIAAFLCWLFSQGRYCEPVYRVIFSLPFGNYVRAPVKWHHLTEFCLVVLAGFGLETLLMLLKRMNGAAKYAVPIVGVVVAVGAIDLAYHAHIYCSPVDLREARRQNSLLQMTFLRKGDFNNPQIAAMVKAKRIVPLANPNPEVYLVGVLEPWKKNTDPLPPLSTAAWLSILSMLGTIGLAGYGLKMALAKRLTAR